MAKPKKKHRLLLYILFYSDMLRHNGLIRHYCKEETCNTLLKDDSHLWTLPVYHELGCRLLRKQWRLRRRRLLLWPLWSK